jgi:hypothetical protein
MQRSHREKCLGLRQCCGGVEMAKLVILDRCHCNRAQIALPEPRSRMRWMVHDQGYRDDDVRA